MAHVSHLLAVDTATCVSFVRIFVWNKCEQLGIEIKQKKKGRNAGNRGEHYLIYTGDVNASCIFKYNTMHREGKTRVRCFKQHSYIEFNYKWSPAAMNRTFLFKSRRRIVNDYDLWNIMYNSNSTQKKQNENIPWFFSHRSWILETRKIPCSPLNEWVFGEKRNCHHRRGIAPYRPCLLVTILRAGP